MYKLLARLGLYHRSYVRSLERRAVLTAQNNAELAALLHELATNPADRHAQVRALHAVQRHHERQTIREALDE